MRLMPRNSDSEPAISCPGLAVLSPAQRYKRLKNC
jgi:hypothetical protein